MITNLGTFEGNIKAINRNSGTVELAEDSAADPVPAEWDSAKRVTIAHDAARIGNTVYTSMDSAFDDAAEGDTIVLLADILRKGKEPIAVDKTVLLDFGGYRLTVDRNTFDIQPTGSLTFINAQINASAVVPEKQFGVKFLMLNILSMYIAAQFPQFLFIVVIGSIGRNA